MFFFLSLSFCLLSYLDNKTFGSNNGLLKKRKETKRKNFFKVIKLCITTTLPRLSPGMSFIYSFRRHLRRQKLSPFEFSARKVKVLDFFSFRLSYEGKQRREDGMEHVNGKKESALDFDEIYGSFNILCN